MGIWLYSGDFPNLDDADDVIEELEADLSVSLPCLLDLPQSKLETLRNLLKPVVRRWSGLGTGLGGRSVTGPFQDDLPEGVRTLQAHEIAKLRALCGSGVGGEPAGSFPPAEPLLDLFAHRRGWCP